MAVSNSGITYIDHLADNNVSWFDASNTALSFTYRTDTPIGTLVSGYTATNITSITNPSWITAGLATWSAVANISHTITPGTPEVIFNEADSITLGSDPQAGIARSYTSGDNYTGFDVLLSVPYISNTPGSSGWQTIVHEIGHVMGLDDVDNIASGYDYDTSIMSYTAGTVATSSRMPSTPMIYDIAAVQYLYGANTGFRATNTTYNGSHFDGSSRAWTVWDAGGVDTFDVSGLSFWYAGLPGAKLDLRGGVDENGNVRFSEILDERVAIALDPESNWEEAIKIEKAIGGIGADILIGNEIANTLQGGGGNDVLEGGAGADNLDGGDGNDTATYVGSSAGVRVNLATGSGDFGDADSDYLTGIENIVGSSYNDTLIGDDGANELDGRDGDDMITGGAGADTIDGGAGIDTASYTDSASGVTVNLGTGAGSGGDAAGDVLSNIEHVAGSNYNDTLTGDSGGNILIGGEGADSIVGGSGDDILYDSVVSLGVFPGAKHSDTLSGLAGDDLIYGLGAAANDNIAFFATLRRAA